MKTKISKPLRMPRLFMLLLALSLSTGAAQSRETKTEQQKPSSHEKQLAKATLLVDLGRYREALYLLDEITKRPEGNEAQSNESTYLRARSYYGLGELSTAERLYEVLTSSGEKDPRAYLGIGLISGRRGDLKRAILFFNKAISIDSNYAKAYLNLGVTMGASKKPSEAEKAFTKAIEIDPRLADAYRNRGIIYESMGNIKKACEDWLAAATLGQDDPRLWHNKQCKQKPVTGDR
jgi:tetratricopeptide (TPR) repeat protein